MKTPASSPGWLEILSAIALLLCATGCIGVVPIPVYSRVPAYGQKVPSARAQVIQPGQTTRAEVLATLGTNCVVFPRTRSIAYTWEMHGGNCVWWIVPVTPEGAGGSSGILLGGWRGFLVAFDDRDIVRAAEFKHLSGRRSLDENMDRWMARLPTAQPVVVMLSLDQNPLASTTPPPADPPR